jgi:hypothetical protein
VDEQLGDEVATCPNGHPLAVGQLVCDVCTGTAHRRRATAGLLVLMSEADRRAEAEARRFHRIRQALIAVSLLILTTASVLLGVREAPGGSTVVSSDAVPPPHFPPILVPSTVTTVSRTAAVGCPQEGYSSLSPELAVSCLYLAWKSGDQRGTQFYASVPAVESLFSRPWSPPDRAFGGCQTTTSTTGTGLQRQTCRYRGITMAVECSQGHGCSVVAVAFTNP